MAKLAILGHKTRGKEVIKILEMLGGKNENSCCGLFTSRIYFIDINGYIVGRSILEYIEYLQLSLEHFEKKYPHKVGDKVCFPDDLSTPFTINKMWWDENANELLCSFVENDIEVPVVGVRAYKEESIDKTNKVIFEANAQSCDIMNDTIKEDMETITIDDFKANTKEWLIDKLGNMSMNDALQTINNIYNELHKPQYPKTYEECCEVLGINQFDVEIDLPQPYQQNIFNLFKLLVCRNAYWKIAGEQMGLGKPWEPDWSTENERKYVIEVYRNNVRTNSQGYSNTILAFPTEEMRDAYKENFDNDIEVCKEFL